MRGMRFDRYCIFPTFFEIPLDFQELRTVRTELSDLRRDVHMKALDAAESGKENIAQDGDTGPNYQQMYNELKVYVVYCIILQ